MTLPECQSPSVGAWLRDAPRSASKELRRLDEEIALSRAGSRLVTPRVDGTGTAIAEAIEVEFFLKPSVGSWLGYPGKQQPPIFGSPRPAATDSQPSAPAAPSTDEPSLEVALAVGEPVEQETIPFPLSPSVGTWLRADPARKSLVDALAAVSDEPESPLVVPEAEKPPVEVPDFGLVDEPPAPEEVDGAAAQAAATYVGDLTKLLSDRLREEAVVEERQPSAREIAQAIGVRPVSPPVTTDLGPRQRPADARLRTNAVATREQVLNFAQSLTSSIFRNSNTLAMHRASSQPQLRRPAASMAATMPAAFTASSSAAAPVADRTQLPPRPAFRKQCSPIPAEEGAFFD